MASDDPLTVLHQRLEALAELSDQVGVAIARGDEARIRDLLVASRRQHVAVGEANEQVQGFSPTADAVDKMRAMRDFTRRIQAGDRAVKEWQARPKPPESELVKTSWGVAAIADALLPAAWDLRHDVIVLVGSGCPPLTRELLARGQERLIVFTPPPAVSDADLPPEVIVVHSAVELRNAVMCFPGDVPRHFTTKKLPDETSTKEQLQEAADMVGEALNALVTRQNTMDVFGEIWALQGIQNLASIAYWPAVDALASSFAGKPFVIISPGPSLAKNMHLLPQLKGKAVLCAFSHTVAALRRVGLYPDLVMTLDPEDLRYHFDGYPTEQVSAMIHGATIHPDVYTLPAQRIFTFAGNSTVEGWIYESLGDNAAVTSGGSVATSALALAANWRCDPIIFVGQDLSFPDGQFYVAGSVDEGTRVEVAADGGSFVTTGFSDKFSQMATMAGAKETRRERLVDVPGYYGGTVKTGFVFQLFLRWFRATAKVLTGRTRLINCTEGGAYLEGMEHIPLAEAIARYGNEPLDVPRLLDEAIARSDRPGRLRKMHARVTEMLEGIDRCSAQAQHCVRLATKAKLRPDLVPKLNEAEGKLTRALQPVQFIAMLRQEQIRAAEHKASEAKTIAQSLVGALELYEVILTAGRVLRPALEKTHAKLADLVRALPPAP